MRTKSKSQGASPQLPFSRPEQPAQVFLAKVDGASRGNPGPASYAVVLTGPDGAAVFEIGKYIGRTTNNVAEYYALIAALDYAVEHGIARLRVQSDSELLVRQMQGRYKVKSPDLKPLHERAQKLSRSLVYFAIEHVRREHNADADALANVALDRTSASPATPLSPPPQSRATQTSNAQRAEGEVRTERTSAAMSQEERLAEVAREAIRRAAQSSSSSMPSQATVAQSSLPAQPAPRERRVRVRYSGGALHPLENIDLVEGDVVEIQISKQGAKNPT